MSGSSLICWGDPERFSLEAVRLAKSHLGAPLLPGRKRSALLRQRSVEARREKARRGELIVASPAGYVKSEEQRLEKDPDRRVQEGVLLVFRKFLELGSMGLRGRIV